MEELRTIQGPALTAPAVLQPLDRASHLIVDQAQSVHGEPPRPTQPRRCSAPELDRLGEGLVVTNVVTSRARMGTPEDSAIAQIPYAIGFVSVARLKGFEPLAF